MSHPTPSATFAILLCALCVALLPFTQSAHAQEGPPPDTIYYNGNILTGTGLRPDVPSATPARVQAIAIASGYIVCAGTNDQVLGQIWKGTHPEKIDLHGAFVMPGFNDAHTHIAFAGQQRLTVDLDNIPSLSAMQAKIKTYTSSLPKGAWITGGGWDHTKWASKALPTRQDLDAVTGTHPAYLERTDGHIAILNSAALAAAHITASTQSPTGGQIDLDPTTHQPTGIVRDAALTPILAIIPQPDAATRRRALQLSIDDALAHGVTSLQDFSDREDFIVLQTMEHEGKLPIRIAEWIPFDLPLDQIKAYQASQPKDDPWLHTSMLKAFMDGSLGSRTAAMLAPYTDDPANSGLPRYDQAKLNAMSAERAAAGFQLGFHAIGDRANTMALDAFAEVRRQQLQIWRAKVSTDPKVIAAASSALNEHRRFRIEHAQVLTPTDFDRFAKLGVIASMQPSHLLTDMAWAGDRLGPERSKYAYAWRSMLDHHITLAFGTDYPVESINPFRGLYAAITRQNTEGTTTFHPEQKITLNEAIYAYTQASAFAEFAEATKGILAKGYWADFIVLDRDITKSTPQELLQTKVLRTVVGGNTQYTAP